MKKSQYTKVMLSVVVIPLLFVGAFNYVVDPLQYYRKTLFSTGFSDNQRQQNPGLAKNYPYDSIVIGDSRTENMLPSNIHKYLGLNALKLSMAGSSAHEQALILNLALSTGKVKNVIWLLSANRFNEGVYDVSDRNGGFPMHLYTGGVDAAFKYLLSIDTISLSINFLTGNSEADLEQLNTWYDSDEFSLDSVKGNYNMYCRSAVRRNSSYEKTSLNSRSNVDENISVNLHSIIQKHENVNFFLYFPPVSIAQHVLNAKFYPDRITEMLEFSDKVHRSVGVNQNTKIFNFLDIESLSHNLDFYKDISHYNINVDNYILESMANERHKYRYDNVANFQKEFAEKIKQYELPFLSDCIQSSD